MNGKAVKTRACLYSEADIERCYRVEHRPGTEEYRSAFRRDYARLIHSPSFRRLQGKTQLFPGIESDFFRNRLTHSLEVAQVAKSIAMKLNSQCSDLKRATPEQRIDYDLVELAALAHDIGHPPFGHNGEAALNDCMHEWGGFEGNAQTLRVLTRIEKRLEHGMDRAGAVLHRGKDVRKGLNLTYRSIASVLKYDKVIPAEPPETKGVQKGYYHSEAELVEETKKAVAGRFAGEIPPGAFKTIECQIMDVADDIAYSTYDLEDAFKAEFLSPLRLLWKISRDADAMRGVLEKVNKNLVKEGIGRIDAEDLVNQVHDIFVNVFQGANATVLARTMKQTDALASQIKEMATSTDALTVVNSVLRTIFGKDHGFPIDIPMLDAYDSSNRISTDGYIRSSFTANLVATFVAGVEISYNSECPALSKVRLKPETRTRVEILKHLTFELIIMSSRLRVVEHRGYDLVHEIFEALSQNQGDRLLPPDYRYLYKKVDGIESKKRVLCDFIACMTDRYALEFNRRLGDAGESIFKPF